MACEAAEEAFWSYGYSTRHERATFLRAIADEIEARAELITEIGSRESGLPQARLLGERERTVGQLRLFAARSKLRVGVDPVGERQRAKRTIRLRAAKVRSEPKNCAAAMSQLSSIRTAG